MVFLTFIGIFGGGEKGFSENYVDFEEFSPSFVDKKREKFWKKPLFIADLKKNPSNLQKIPSILCNY